MRIKITSAIRWPVLGLLAFTQVAGAGQAPQEPHRPIPFSMLEEHAEIHLCLKAAVEAGGATALAAREVLALVGPHMQREQRLALAPLRLLPRLATREIAPDMNAMIAVTDQLRAELPALMKEHQAIRKALGELWAAAWRDGRPEHALVAQRINRHLTVDEEVHFPAALVIGDYLRLATGQKPGPPPSSDPGSR